MERRERDGGDKLENYGEKRALRQVAPSREAGVSPTGTDTEGTAEPGREPSRDPGARLADGGQRVPVGESVRAGGTDTAGPATAPVLGGEPERGLPGGTVWGPSLLEAGPVQGTPPQPRELPGDTQELVEDLEPQEPIHDDGISEGDEMAEAVHGERHIVNKA